jgi:hypothetical protein
MPKLFSYVVEHDYGFAPNPSNNYCTLAYCKFGGKRKNILELAEEKKEHWIVGTGGIDTNKSAGHGKLLFAMRVDEKITLFDYYRDARFRCRIDNLLEGSGRTDRFILLSQHYFYFGRNAVDIQNIPKNHLTHSLEKKGPGFRNDFNTEFIHDFANWLTANYTIGILGPPCVSAG